MSYPAAIVWLKLLCVVIILKRQYDATVHFLESKFCYMISDRRKTSLFIYVTSSAKRCNIEEETLFS